MFCSTLRKRPEWAPAVPAFLQKEPRNWKECKLGTHDVVIPTSKTPDGCEILFRFVLLSALDMEKEDTWQRMERLYHLDGGSNCAVVFLLQTECVGNAMASYMAFEMRIMDKFAMPVIPLTSAANLAATLEFFSSRLTTTKPPAPFSSASAPQALLPHCAVGSPLSPHANNVLSDINSCYSDLVDKAANPEGQMILQDYVGEDAERIIRFWMGDDAMY